MSVHLYPCLLFDFDFFPSQSDLHCPIFLQWPSNLVNRHAAPEQTCLWLKKNSYTDEKKKKTHILQFQQRQKKCKRPTRLAPVYMSGCRLIRFGTLAGIRDTRCTRCPLRGISHGIFIKPGKTCSCQTFTLCPSPLLSLIKSEHLFKLCMPN